MIFTTACAGCNEPGALLCHRCRFALVSAPSPAGGQQVVAALPFEGVARQVVLGLKYRNRRGVARLVARLMVRRLRLDPVDLVTWAPTAPARARQRGYDQAELLARAVARELGVPCRRLLYRVHGSPQTGRSRSERLNGPDFRVRAARPGLRVLVIDDVVTTGATLRAARQVLLRAGVADVRCIAAAATPSTKAARQASAPNLARAS